MSKTDTTTSKAAQIAYDILAPLGCKDFDNSWREATKLINDALVKEYEQGFIEGENANDN